MRLVFFIKRIQESNVTDKLLQVFPESRQPISNTLPESKKLIFMKFCPRCEKTAQRHHPAGYYDENDGRFETFLKLVHGTFDDNWNNITS